MAYVNIQNTSLSFGGTPLFEAINLTVERGEKVALVGRNGSGKSTLLKLIAGLIQPHSGTIAIQKDARSTYLDQLVPGDMPGSVFEVVKSGSGQLHHISEEELERKIGKVISQFGLDGGRSFNDLSAGLKRQALLAKALLADPDILLLDEPTNHMDIDAIKRLEDTVLKFRGSVILVTHDREFLQKIASRIVEIDRGRLFDQTCDYETFLERREAAGEIEATENALFDKKLEKEEAWIRTGIKARRTRNEGRVRALEKMRQTRQSRRLRPGTVKLATQKAENSGNLVVEAENVNFDYEGIPVIRDFTTTIMKGDRVGILGPNGSGKTTLLRLLLGELQPASGVVHMGTNLQISYSDQLRGQLDETKTVMENVAEGSETVIVNGRPRNIYGYLQDFEFSREQALSYVSYLSGGERNRLVLARLFTRPSNLLVLDEPTNDLDLETLEILEDYLMNYQGTILMVSHDRAFINNVVTSTLVFDEELTVNEYIGGYEDWLRQRPLKEKLVKATKPKPVPEKQRRQSVKFGFRQQKELESLPHTIQELETEQYALYQDMGNPDTYKNDISALTVKQNRIKEIDELLVSRYARWEELERLQAEAAQ
ncbi:MAG: ATP-binding cassette domain-containing protein [Dehalogenimonas sp.]